MASRSIDDLHPALQPVCIRFLALCADKKINVILTCTYRSNKEQAALYAIGRTKPGKKVTNAKPGQSYHNHTEKGSPASKAFDIAVVVNGKIDWSGTNAGWAAAGKIGKSLGLVWGGDWKTGRDLPHFQIEV